MHRVRPARRERSSVEGIGEGGGMSEIRFDDRVVLVTGAGRGLGAAYAEALAARGASVVVHDAGVEPDGTGGDPAIADRLVAEIEAAGGTAVACYENIESEAACLATVELALERFGRLDVVINNAGLLIWEELEAAHRGWDRMRRVNVDAPFHLTRAAFPAMKEQGYGRFVFTTSGRAMSVERTRAGLAAYAVGKMAHFALMVVTAREGEPYGILANAVAPAAATRMLQRPVAPGELEAAQVAPGVLFLASERCSVTGRVLEAAGGAFDVARWTSSGDVDFGLDPVDPEAIAERWPEIEGTVQAA
jgi:NAD(P)-dependent dehydrogenase (short-subunit alcohol dehydrogenase family)